MPWKRDDDSPRGHGRRTDLTNALRRGERGLFVYGTQFLLLGLFLVFTIIAAAQSAPLLAALGGIGVFLLARVLFPLDRIVDLFEWVACGEAGKWLHNGYLRVMPGRSPDDRRGRGQTSLKTLLALTTVVLLVAVLAVSGVAVADDDENESAEVVHDDYLTDPAYTAEFNDTQEVELTDRNVRTKIEETDVFVRLEAENPNSYPVDMTVKLDPDIVPPAEVGEVSAADDDITSTWRNTHDFERDQSHTEVTFTVDADSEVTFAPNRIRVLGIAWKDETTDTDRWRDRIPSPFGDDNLEERTYEINSSSGSIVTVPMEHSDGQSIDDWQAVYRVGPDDTWKPITTDSDDPAFYRTTDGGDSLQLHFDTNGYADSEVEVEFTANPTRTDRAKHELRSVRAGWSDLFNFNILSTASLPAAEVTLS